MPRVESYGPQRVKPAPLPNRRKETGQATPTAATFGAAAGRGMEELGSTALNVGTRLIAQQNQIAAEARERADTLAVLSASNKLGNWSVDALSAAQEYRGQAAMGLPEKIRDEFTKTAGDIAATLTTDRQRIAFAREQESRWEHVNATVQSHVGRELDTWHKQEVKDGLELSLSSAATYADTPDRVGAERARGLQILDEWTKSQGMGPAATAAARINFTTSLHAGVINQLLTGEKDRAAQIYYDEVKGEITGEARTKLEAALHEGTTRGESQQIADAILQQATSQAEALKQARAVERPELRDAVEARVQRYWSEKQQGERDDIENLMIKAGNLVDAGRPIPPGDWVRMTMSQRTAIEQYRKRNEKGTDETDAATYYRLMKMAADDPDTFKNENLMMVRAKLSKGDWKQIVEQQMSIRKGKTTNVDLDGFRTNERVVNDTLDQAAIARTGEKKDLAFVAHFNREVSTRVAALQSLTGKKATEQDVQAVADDLLRTVTLQKGSWWNILPGGAPFRDVTKRLIDVDVHDIPDAERRQIEQALRTAKRPLTDSNVVNLYLETQRRLGSRP